VKLLIAGAGGMLGTELMSRLSAEHDCAGVDVADFDITDRAAALAFAKKIKPDMIINAAAYTDVDGCEANADVAYAVNADGAGNLAEAAALIDVPIIYFSTDYVFDGGKGGPYDEDDAPNPLGVYGRAKLEGENRTKLYNGKHFIIRIQSLYGKNGKNFVTTIIKAAREKGELRVVDDQWSRPTYAADVADAIGRLIRNRSFGTYHVANGGVVSWYSFAEEILRQTGMTEVKLAPCAAADYPRPAARPRYSPLECRNWRLGGYEPLRPYGEALADFLTEIGEAKTVGEV